MKPSSSDHFILHKQLLYQMCLIKSLKQPRTPLTRQAGDRSPSTQLHSSRHLQESSCYQTHTVVPQRVTSPVAQNRDGKHCSFLSGCMQCYGITLCSKRLGLCLLCIKHLVLLLREKRRVERSKYHNIVKVDFLKVRIIALYSFQSFLYIR